MIPANLRLFGTLTICAITGFVVAGCPDNTGAVGGSGGGSSTSSTSSGTGSKFTAGGGTGASGSSGSKGQAGQRNSYKFTLVQAIPQAASGAGASGASGASGGAAAPSDPPIFELVFNAINTTNTLTDVCGVQNNGTGGNFDPSKTCKCTYTWNQQNQSDASVITRTIETAPTQITSFDVLCPGPGPYYDQSEIPDNTIINISLKADAGAGNTSGFASNTVQFKKLPVTTNGDFRDTEGNSFKNVLHYVCYDMLKRSLSITHNIKAAFPPSGSGSPPQATVANEFVTGAAASADTFSAQSYYYDFYIRNLDQSPKTGNNNYTCPMVNIKGDPSYYPYDSQFAVALQRSVTFPVAIAGRASIDPPPTPPGFDVIGYAAKPNADGTCPSFTDTNGRIRRTFRLRQYSALYPIRFDANGDVKDQSQPINTIYVLDRPVDKLGQDPLKPLTRLGPKPCPFSFKTAQFGQKCMTDASLSGWNVDGIQIDGNPKCPIYPPVPDKYLKKDGTLVIRPFKPFLPHYLENTAFRACAFQSSTPIDPEIVLSHDDSVFPAPVGPNDFYCAKYYPAAGSIIPPPGGDIFNKAPGACDDAQSASSIKTDKTYACTRTIDLSGNPSSTPSAGCCQICTGPDCTTYGGGRTAKGRNAAFSPPRDPSTSGTNLNPPTAYKVLPRALPNDPNSGGCFDPFED